MAELDEEPPHHVDRSDHTGPDAAHATRRAEGEAALPTKQVSAKAARRLNFAKDAIAATKRVLHFGAGNQIEAIAATKMNSTFRLHAMREPSYWTLAPEVRQLAEENPEATAAAKADLVHGGNCGEHADLAFEYLRRSAPGEQILYAGSEIDHAFVLLGDHRREKANEVAVADPWPTRATACLWEDHFCFGTAITVYQEMKADGRSLKSAIAAGLRLSEEGKRVAESAESQEETDRAVQNWKENHFWRQPNSAAEGHMFQYSPSEASR